MANAGYDFIWTEHQHDARDWQTTQRMWGACPRARAVPGVRVAYTDEREEQHALDAGALVLVVPTVRSYEEALKARDWAYFPPLGRRSNGGGQAFALYNGVPCGCAGLMPGATVPTSPASRRAARPAPSRAAPRTSWARTGTPSRRRTSVP